MMSPPTADGVGAAMPVLPARPDTMTPSRLRSFTTDEVAVSSRLRLLPAT